MHSSSQESFYKHQQSSISDRSPPLLSSKPLPPTPGKESDLLSDGVSPSETTSVRRKVRKKSSRGSRSSRSSRSSSAAPSQHDGKDASSSSSSNRRSEHYRPPAVNTATASRQSVGSETCRSSSSSTRRSAVASSSHSNAKHGSQSTFLVPEDAELETQLTTSSTTYSSYIYSDSRLSSSTPSLTSNISERLHHLRDRIAPEPFKTDVFDYAQAEKYLNLGLLVAAGSVALIYLPVEEKIKRGAEKLTKGKTKQGKTTEKGKYRVKGDSWGPE